MTGRGKEEGGCHGGYCWCSSICFCYSTALEASPVLEEHKCFFFFSWNSIAKEKKGSRTEVEGSVLSKDNATFMGKQADMESASLKKAVGNHLLHDWHRGGL